MCASYVTTSYRLDGNYAIQLVDNTKQGCAAAAETVDFLDENENLVLGRIFVLKEKGCNW